MIHRWSLELERKTESSLNFDPHAAYVQSEVATIVRKARDDAVESKRIDLGPGLIIHDLEAMENQSNDGPGTQASPTQIERDTNDKQNESKQVFQAESPNQTNPENVRPQAVAQNVQFSFMLIALLVVVAAFIFFWSKSWGA